MSSSYFSSAGRSERKAKQVSGQLDFLSCRLEAQLVEPLRIAPAPTLQCPTTQKGQLQRDEIHLRCHRTVGLLSTSQHTALSSSSESRSSLLLQAARLKPGPTIRSAQPSPAKPGRWGAWKEGCECGIGISLLDLDLERRFVSACLFVSFLLSCSSCGGRRRGRRRSEEPHQNLASIFPSGTGQSYGAVSIGEISSCRSTSTAHRPPSAHGPATATATATVSDQ